MNIYFIGFLAILPVIGVLYYVNAKDVVKEPRYLLRNLFIYGCLSSISVYFLELFLNFFFPVDGVTDFAQMFLNVFLGIALVEEGMKLSGVLLIAMKNGEFDCRYDAIVYCVYSSLGFAFIENFLYILGSIADGDVITTVIGRAIFSIPGHAMFGAMMGYFVGLAKEAKIKKSGSYFLYLILSLAMPMLVHTVYDWALMMSSASSYLENGFNLFYIALFVLSFIFALIISIALINRTSKIKTDFFGKNLVEMMNFIASPAPNPVVSNPSAQTLDANTALVNNTTTTVPATNNEIVNNNTPNI